MSNPFTTAAHQTTAATVLAPTDGQVRFLTNLLAERAWDTGLAAKPVTQARVREIQAAITTDTLATLDPALTRKGASTLLDLLQSFPKVQEHARAASTAAGFPSAEEVPAGRYAIATTSADAVNGLAFYKVDRPTEGKWAGAVFVRLMKSDDEIRLGRAAAASIMTRIQEVGAEAASKAYGLEIGECGVCGRTLTNDASREAGIGPKCAAKFF